MNDKQYKNIQRAFNLVWFLMFIVIVALIFLLAKSGRPTEINNFAGKEGPAGKSVVGPQGVQGNPGIGLQGIPGNNGTNGSTQIFNYTTNIPVPGPQGEKGDTGAPGADGRQLLIRLDPDTCQLETKYDGDDFWQVLAQLSKPCDPSESTDD